MITIAVPRLKSFLPTVYFCPTKDNIGYIRIPYFSKNSSKDFFAALSSFSKQKVTNVIVDLRCNPGGEIEESIAIADKLLEDGRIICSLRGKLNLYNNTYYAKGKAQYDNIKFIILVDGGTAGAAEVLAGAMQDNDRAIIVGTRRTFGRAIVRHSVRLNDSSEMLITAAKYYTPSGRSIHKSLQGSPEEAILPGDYQKYSIGYYKTDIVTDSENIFRTVMGRIVKGGGGIMPDFIVVADSTHYPLVLDKINHIIKKIAREYVAENGNKLSKMSFDEYVKSFEVTNIIVDQVVANAEQSAIQCDNGVVSTMRPFIRTKLKMFIAQAFWKDDSYIKLIVNADEVVAKCQRIFEETSILEESDENI